MARISKDELIKLQKTLKTDVAIGKKIGVSAQYIQQLRKLYDIPPSSGARTAIKPPRITQKELIQLQKTFQSDDAIAKEVGITASRVNQLRREYGIPVIHLREIKRNNKIIDYYNMGTSIADICIIFGLQETQAKSIIMSAGARNNGCEKISSAIRNRKFGCLSACNVY
jgi:hypothetical protein